MLHHKQKIEVFLPFYQTSIKNLDFGFLSRTRPWSWNLFFKFQVDHVCGQIVNNLSFIENIILLVSRVVLLDRSISHPTCDERSATASISPPAQEHLALADIQPQEEASTYHVHYCGVHFALHSHIAARVHTELGAARRVGHSRLNKRLWLAPLHHAQFARLLLSQSHICHLLRHQQAVRARMQLARLLLAANAVFIFD